MGLYILILQHIYIYLEDNFIRVFTVMTLQSKHTVGGVGEVHDSGVENSEAVREVRTIATCDGVPHPLPARQEAHVEEATLVGAGDVVAEGLPSWLAV